MRSSWGPIPTQSPSPSRHNLRQKARVTPSFPLGALLGALGRELGCRRCPALYRSEGVDTPMLLGLFCPVVLVPAGELDQDGLSLMLRHELAHLRRHDVACKLLFQLVCVLHWFNPLVWWLGREAGRNLELCCDEDVVRGKDRAFRRSYGEVLLKAAAGRGRLPALSARMGGGKGHLKARLGNLYIKKKNSGALVCAVLAAAILGGSLVSCSGEAPEPGRRYTHDLSEQWAGITDLYLSVALGEESMDIDLLTDIAGIVPSEWADGLSVGWYIRDAGRFAHGLGNGRRKNPGDFL